MEIVSMNSALLWVDQGAFDWYWPLLTEGVHYLKATESIESIEEQAHWALSHDRELQLIVRNMRAKAAEIFDLDHLLLYVTLVAPDPESPTIL